MRHATACSHGQARGSRQTTEELGVFITTTIYKKLATTCGQGLEVLSQVNFKAGTASSREGTYIWGQDGAYHVIYAKRSSISNALTLKTTKEVLVYVLDMVAFEEACAYELKHRVSNQDSRRLIFAKELEIFSKFGPRMAQIKKREIEEVLEKFPYDDSL